MVLGVDVGGVCGCGDCGSHNCVVCKLLDGLR
jgi:hypothetical protein